jgi:hypothetical protein
LAIGVYLATNLNIWLDEAFSLETSGHGLAHAISRAVDFELQPPLYFALLSLWRQIDEGVLWARLLSLFASTAAVLVMVAVSRAYLPLIASGVVALVFALNPFLVWAAVEIRPYSLVVLISVLLLLVFQRAYLARDIELPWALGHAMLALTALYTQHYLGFLLLAQGISLLLLGRRRACIHFLLFMGGVACLASPMFLAAMGQVEEHRPRTFDGLHASDAPIWAYRRLRGLVLSEVSPWQLQMLHELQDCAACGVAAEVAGRMRGAQLLLIPGLLALGGLFVARALWLRRMSKERVALLSLTLTLGVCFAVVAAVVGLSVVDVRHMAAWLPLAVLLPFVAVEACGSPRVAAVWAAVVLCFGLPVLGAQYAPMAKTGDFARIADHVSRYPVQGLPVAVFHCSTALPLEYHYSGPSPLVPLVSPINLARLEPERCILPSERDVRVVLARSGPGRGIWLVDSQSKADFGVDYKREHLDRVVDSCFAVVWQRAFYGATLTLLHPTSRCPEFSAVPELAPR